MISENSELSISKQCKILGLSRSSYYHESVEKEPTYSAEYCDELMKGYIKFPFYGYRRMSEHLKAKGFISTQKMTRNAMKQNNLKAIYPSPNTSISNIEHKKYSYLLRGLKIDHVNHVWASDITYIKVNGCFVYLVAVIDIYSRKVLTWKLSNTLDATFCINALKEAIEVYGKPKIFNTDQGSQYTSKDFLEVLVENKVQISMDGKGRALDNIYIERLWRSLKYENIYLNGYESVIELKTGIKKYFEFYNKERYHQSLKYKTPDYIYHNKKVKTG